MICPNCGHEIAPDALDARRIRAQALRDAADYVQNEMSLKYAGSATATADQCASELRHMADDALASEPHKEG